MTSELCVVMFNIKQKNRQRLWFSLVVFLIVKEGATLVMQLLPDADLRH